MKTIYTFLILILASNLLNGQNFHVYDVNSDEYPIINAKFYVTDSNNKQITQFVPEEFQIVENMINRTVREIECSSKPVFNRISTVLTIDVSGSMKGQRLDWVKLAASQWIGQMDTLNEETAITTFDDEALLYSDFKINKSLLLQSIATLEIRNGTNYKNAFLDPYAGALDVARRAQFKPIIIFLTDGVGLSDFNPSDIVKRAEELGAIVYSISIDISLPLEMKAVSDATGGQYFENIDSQEKLINVYNTIRKIAISTSPCNISWFTEGCLQGRIADIKYRPLNLDKKVSYNSPGEKFPEFEYLNGDFALFECQKQFTNIIRLKAVTDKINIYGINKNNSVAICSDFTAKFINRKVPFTLEKDSIVEIAITYNPTDSKHKFCEFEIDASSCQNNKIIAVSNCLNSPPSEVPINIRRPNGGEVFKANTVEKIFWNGTPQNSEIMIDYSLDSGKNWSLVNLGKMYNTSVWNIPNVESDNCLVRVKKISDIAGRKIYDASIDSSDVNKISWNKRGNVFAILSDTNSIKLFNSITGEKINEFFMETDTSSFIDVQFFPDGARLFVTNPNGLYIFNVLNKKFDLINNLSGELELSKDEKIITVTNSDSIAIMDIQTREILNVFHRPIINGKISGSAISNDSRKIAFCLETKGISDSIYVYENSTTWKVTSRYTMTDTSEKYSYQNIDWNYDDKFIFTSSAVGTIRFIELWDLSTKKKEVRLFRPDTRISDIEASSIENLLVTVDHGSNVIVLEVVEKDGKKEFQEKYSFISNSLIDNTIEWSPDYTRFVVGTNGLPSDNLLAVYSVKAYPEYEDISDSVFSIRKTVFEVNDIDLGTELVGQTKDSTITNLLKYNFEYPFQIDSVNISGIDKAMFSISNSPTLPNVANSVNQPNFEFGFTPNREANFTATLNIYSQFGLKTSKLLAKGVKPLVQVENYNFGEVLITKDSTIKKKSIINNGSSILIINKIYLVGPSDKYFKLLDASGNTINEITNLEIDPKEEFEVSIQFLPLIPEIENARLRIEYVDVSNAVTTTHINLYGEGINPNLEFSNSINFGNVICDETKTETITVYNKGRGNITISDIKINSSNFTILNNFNFNIKLQGGDSLSFDVEFKPIDNGVIKDSILIFTNELESNIRKIYLNARKLNTSFVVSGNNNLVGADNNVVINETFRVINNGKTDLIWNNNLPYISKDGKIEVLSVSPDPTLQGDTAIVNYRFNGGDKGESFNFKFAPQPYCSDSIDISVNIKNTQATLFTAFESEFHIVCEDTLKIKILVTNIGEEELSITNIRFENDNSILFTVDKKIITLQGSESDTLTIIFATNNVGIYNTDLVFISNDSKSTNGKLSKPIKIKKDISNFEIIEDDVQFVFNGLNNPGNKTFNIKNTGSVSIRWNIQPLPGFNLVSIDPLVAQPGQSSVITVNYSGPNDISSENILIVNDSCMNQDSIIFNVVSAGNGIAVLSLPQRESRKIGEVFNYPITLSNSNKLDEAGVTTISGQLFFNHSLMRPTKLKSRIDNGVRIIPFEISNLDKGAILNIEMEALWGDDSCAVVAMDSLSANGNTTDIEIDQEIGLFCVSDLCYEGGVRLIDLSVELSATVKIIDNNSNELNIELNLIEKGLTEIKILDFNGRNVMNLLSDEIPLGYNNLSRNISNISNGVYMIEVITPSITIYRKLIIVR
ncbi:MAG: choice-of-anchor D domain-containing protein [Candidatus Kapaibacterium sp.]